MKKIILAIALTLLISPVAAEDHDYDYYGESLRELEVNRIRDSEREEQQRQWQKMEDDREYRRSEMMRRDLMIEQEGIMDESN